MRVHAIVAGNVKKSSRASFDLNIIETHVFLCVIVCLAPPTEDRLGLFPLRDRLNAGCRLGCNANSTELHEAYQQRGRHEDMSAAIGQPSETLPFGGGHWETREARLGIQPICDSCVARMLTPT